MWTNYYNQFADTQIVDTGDALAQNWGATVKWLNAMQQDLFKSYDTIIFADMDEILVPDPDKYKDLGEYIKNVDKSVIRATGYNIIELPNQEPIDFTKPIIKQRDHWQRDTLYDKYVILKEPQHYTSNHTINNSQAPEEDLVLYHLRDADPTSARERLKAIGRNLNEQDLEYRQSQAVKIPKKWRIIWE
jgi:hypothetical protein